MPDLVTMQTPFDQLAERYGPEGQGARKPCPLKHLPLHILAHTAERVPMCDDGYLLDETHPLLNALWTQDDRPGLSHWACPQRGKCHIEFDQDCLGTGYIRRSREEAWYLLPGALAKTVKQGFYYLISERGVDFWIGGGGWFHPVSVPQEVNEHPLDTVARAILEAEDARP